MRVTDCHLRDEVLVGLTEVEGILRRRHWQIYFWKSGMGNLAPSDIFYHICHLPQEVIQMYLMR